METARRGETPKQQGSSELFEGNVEIDRLTAADGVPGTAAVTFHAGARTHWHSHSGGQILYVLEGEGRVGTVDGVTEMRPGDVVAAPPGERHWHGAAEGRDMTHLTISIGDASWFEAVE
ncbi:MAG: cupin domain-containing protein [Tepidiformaceae bacterium]